MVNFATTAKAQTMTDDRTSRRRSICTKLNRAGLFYHGKLDDILFHETSDEGRHSEICLLTMKMGGKGISSLLDGEMLESKQLTLCWTPQHDMAEPSITCMVEGKHMLSPSYWNMDVEVIRGFFPNLFLDMFLNHVEEFTLKDLIYEDVPSTT